MEWLGKDPERRIPVQTVILPVILGLFGLSLIFQSVRWTRTPSYGNLLHILSADVWGVIHLLVAALFVVSILLRPQRMVSVIAHTLGFVLLAGWELAFVVRYLTDGATTIVNVVSWGTYLFLLILSARRIEGQPEVGLQPA